MAFHAKIDLKDLRAELLLRIYQSQPGFHDWSNQISSRLVYRLARMISQRDAAWRRERATHIINVVSQLLLSVRSFYLFSEAVEDENQT